MAALLAASGNTLKVWDLSQAAGQEFIFEKWPGGPADSVAFSQDSRTIVTTTHTDNQGFVEFWDIQKGVTCRAWTFPGPVRTAAFAPDDRHVATANGNGTVYILVSPEFASKQAE